MEVLDHVELNGGTREDLDIWQSVVVVSIEFGHHLCLNLDSLLGDNGTDLEPKVSSSLVRKGREHTGTLRHTETGL